MPLPPLHDKGDPNPPLDADAAAAFDEFAAATGAVVIEKVLPWNNNHGEYHVATDKIILRSREQWFGRPIGYYSTLCHELIHWTGPRLGRMPYEQPNESERAFEELIAECGSVALAKHFNVYVPPRGGDERFHGHLRFFPFPEDTMKSVQAEVARAMKYLLELSRR